MVFAGTKTRGPNCCDPIFLDAFGDSSASNTLWQDYGSRGTFAAGELEITTAGVVMHPNEPPPDLLRQVAKVKVLFSGTGGSAEAQLWMGADDDNRIVAELEGGDDCGSLKLLVILAGVSTTAAAIPVGPIANDVQHELILCYERDSYTGVINVSAVVSVNDGPRIRVGADAADHGWADDPVLNGLGSGDVDTGIEIHFDDFTMLPHKASTGGCGCPDCGPPCSQVLDNFERTDIGCCWFISTSGADPSSWSIVSGELSRDGSSAEDLVHVCLRASPSYTYSGRIYLPTAGSKARLFAHLETPLTGLYHGAEIEAGDTCGKLRMIQSGEIVGEWVAVTNLTPGWHRLRICYSRDNGVLSATVDGEYSHHIKDVTAPTENHYVGLGVGTGSGYLFDDLRLGNSLDAGATIYGDCPNPYDLPGAACCAGLDLEPSFFAKVFKNGVLINIEYELDLGFHDGTGYEFRNAANTMQLICVTGETPYFIYDAPGLFHQFDLTVESCSPYFATGTYTSGADVYELEVYQ